MIIIYNKVGSPLSFLTWLEMYICFVSPRSKTRWYYSLGETRMEKDRIFLWFSPIHSDVINELQFVSNSHQTNKINWHNLKYTDTKLAIENALLIKNCILRKPFIFSFHLFRQNVSLKFSLFKSNKTIKVSPRWNFIQISISSTSVCHVIF